MQAISTLLMPRRTVVCPMNRFYNGDRGRCMPASLLLQLEASGHEEAMSGTKRFKAVDDVRLEVLRFAEHNRHAPWAAGDKGQDKLGKVIAAATCADYFRNGLTGDWERDFRSWLRRMHDHPERGCDDAWLFAAAARYGLRVFVYTCPGIMMKRFVLSAPRTAWAPRSLHRPRSDVHLGFVQGRNGEQHCVSLPLA